MGAEASEYVPPREVALFSEPLPAHDGLSWPVCEVGVGGMPHETGGTPKRGHFVWGASGDAPADAVFVKVTDLGGLKDGGEDAYLWACLYDGRLFLHLGASAPAGGSGELPEAGEGFVGASDAAGVLDGDGTGRHAGPDAYICSMDDRDAYLKITDRATGVSRWRADLSWDVLALLRFSTVATLPPGGWPYSYATVWVAVSGNVVCFYTTVADSMDFANWAVYGSVTCQYGGDPRAVDEPAAGQGLGSVQPVYLEGVGSSLVPMYVCAALPWQGAGAGYAVFPDDAKSAEMDCGTLNCTVTDEVAGMPFGNSSFLPDPGIYFCPRLHVLSSRRGGFMPDGPPGFTDAEISAVLYGGAGDFDVIDGRFHLNGLMVAPGCNMLFNPWSVEGLGLSKRFTLDFAREDARDYLPPAPGAGWVCVAAATLEGPGGPVRLELAGADVDGVLLTASGCTENFD